jgi:hypothetical protein
MFKITKPTNQVTYSERRDSQIMNNIINRAKAETG